MRLIQILKMNCITIILINFSLVVIQNNLLRANEIDQTVISTGSLNATSGNISVSMIIGQTVIGSSSSASTHVDFGYLSLWKNFGGCYATIPSFVNVPDTLLSELGETAIINIVVSGSLSNFQWYKYTNPLTDTGRFIGTKSETLKILNASFSDSGDYSLIVYNCAGVDTSKTIKLKIDIATGIHDEGLEALPISFKLGHNYPNPFNPSTTIEYSISKSTNVEISIYNIAGQLVKKLINSKQSPGYYSVVWDGTNQSGTKVSSGIYYFRMSTEAFSKTNKMIMLR